MVELSMCGYRCDICKAFAPNINENDQRKTLSAMWNKYFDFYIPPEEIYCDGCRSSETCSRRLDSGCPVRSCVLKKDMNSCGDCPEYPCDIFMQREGLSYTDAAKKLEDKFNTEEYNEYILAYDNKTRLDRYVEENRK